MTLSKEDFEKFVEESLVSFEYKITDNWRQDIRELLEELYEKTQQEKPLSVNMQIIKTHVLPKITNYCKNNNVRIIKKDLLGLIKEVVAVLDYEGKKIIMSEKFA